MNTARSAAEDAARARSLAARLRHDRETLLRGQLDELRQAFAAIVADAEQYRAQSVFAPWEFYDAVGDHGAAIAALRAKYQVGTGSRHRPPPEETPPLTEIFFEAYALLATLDQGLLLGPY